MAEMTQQDKERVERVNKRREEQRKEAKRPSGEKSLLFKRRQERLEKLKNNATPKRVRVHPRDDAVRNSIRRGIGRDPFPAEGSVEWPLDTFTKRRLRDGSVRLENEAETRARDTQRQEDQQRQAGNGNPQREQNRREQRAPAPASETTRS